MSFYNPGRNNGFPRPPDRSGQAEFPRLAFNLSILPSVLWSGNSDALRHFQKTVQPNRAKLANQ